MKAIDFWGKNQEEGLKALNRELNPMSPVEKYGGSVVIPSTPKQVVSITQSKYDWLERRSMIDDETVYLVVNSRE